MKTICRAVLPLCLVACSTWHGPQPLQSTGKAPVDNVFAMDEAAWQLVALQNHRVAAVDGRLDVSAELVNLSSLDLNIQVRTTFRDKDGILLGDGGIWEMLVIPGNGSKPYHVTSLSEKAATAQIEVKTP